MNENLCQALLQARLTEEDVATHLQVDPKTVRRWLEGRVPYLRHRWALAALLGRAETDLWPQLRAQRTTPGEVRAIYPHLDAVPQQVWVSLFGSAQDEIGILTSGALHHADEPEILGLIAARAAAGVEVRICLARPAATRGGDVSAGQEAAGVVASRLRAALTWYAPLPTKGQVVIRVCRGPLYQSIYRTDDEVLVAQHAHGIPAGESPVLHLRRAEGGDMVSAYLDSFERVWTQAQPLP